MGNKPPYDGFTYPARGPFYRNVSQIRGNANAFRAHRARCTWAESNAATALEGLYYQRTTDDSGATDDTPEGAKAGLRLQECTVHDTTDGDDSWWVIQRVGPLVSHGGDSTHFVSWNDAARVRAKLEEGPKVYMTGFVGHSINATTGAAIGNPPIHQHHAHLNPELNPYAWFTGFHLAAVVRSALAAMMLDPWRPASAVLQVLHAIADGRIDQVHGDAQCHEAGGGMDCMVHRVPAPYGSPVLRPFFTDAMLTDMRAGNSPPLTIWFESAVRLTRRACALEVSPLFRKTAALVDATRPVLFGILPDVYVTYRVPTSQNSYKADVQPVAPHQQWIVVQNHMHRRIALEQWLIIGHKVTPARLGFEWTPDGHELASPVLVDGPGQPSGDSIKQQVLRNVKELRDAGEHVVLCIDNGEQVTKFVPTKEEYDFGLRAGEYDRYSGLYCDREGIVTSRPDEPTAFAVQVAFHRPPANSDYPLSWFPMHATLHIQANGSRPEVLSTAAEAELGGSPTRQTEVLSSAAKMSHRDVSMSACYCCLYLAVLLGVLIALVSKYGRRCVRSCRWKRVPTTMSQNKVDKQHLLLPDGKQRSRPRSPRQQRQLLPTNPQRVVLLRAENDASRELTAENLHARQVAIEAAPVTATTSCLTATPGDSRANSVCSDKPV